MDERRDTAGELHALQRGLERGRRIRHQRDLYVGPEFLQQAVIHRQGDDAPLPGLPSPLGDYHIIRQVAKGGMGRVFDAWQISLDRRVALKVLRWQLRTCADLVQRFRREARIAARIHHPNTVEVYDMGIVDGLHYFTMEYVEGTTLDDLRKGWSERERGAGEKHRARADADTRLIKRGESSDGSSESEPPDNADSVASKSAPRGKAGFEPPPIEFRDACLRQLVQRLAAVADALHSAHEQNIVHRDVKPANLMLDAHGAIRILDFGLACVQGQDTCCANDEFSGTPVYMSPEQVLRTEDALRPCTDIYSFGATLYDVLGGRPPHVERTCRATLDAVVHEVPASLRGVNPHVPEELGRIVMRCLEKNPGDRYRKADDLARDLMRWATGHEALGSLTRTCLSCQAFPTAVAAGRRRLPRSVPAPATSRNEAQGLYLPSHNP